jgi:hypothetical protein
MGEPHHDEHRPPTKPPAGVVVTLPLTVRQRDRFDYAIVSTVSADGAPAVVADLNGRGAHGYHVVAMLTGGRVLMERASRP